MIDSSAAPHAQENGLYCVRLYVADNEDNSRLARDNLEQICDEYLKGRCRIEEVDVLNDFSSALKDNIFVTPALVLMAPEPRVTLVGSLNNRERVVTALRLRINKYGT